MSAYGRIALLMLAAFAVVYAVGAIFYLQQARLDVQRELDSVSGLAGMIGTPEQVGAGVVATLRHLRPAGDGLTGDEAGSAPAWFIGLVAGNRAERFPVTGGWQVDPSDEIEEIWENFLIVSLAYSIGMLLCFAALFWAVGRVTAPLRILGQAMADVGSGQLVSRLPRQPITEVDQLVCRFNTMASELESEQKTVARLLNELLELQDRERAHIARVLHDDLGQYITGIRAQARSWLYDPGLDERQKSQARDLAEHCETVQRHFRHLLQDLHPLVMEQMGLGSAIHHLVEQWQQLSGLPCDLVVDSGLPEFAGEKQTHLYRFVQEALNNVSRHAAATRVNLGVIRKPDSLRVEIGDDGVGADNLLERAGLGLRSMRERARCLGGKAEFISRSGRGTRVCLTIPLA